MIFALGIPTVCASAGNDAKAPEFAEKMEGFAAAEEAAHIEGIWDKISYRAEQVPFLLVATIIFILAIAHTFFAVPLTKYSHF